MTSKRQRPISISHRDRDVLDSHKKRYEQASGDSMDWGQFLLTVTLLGLAAAGIYKLVKANQKSPELVEVQCPECQNTFSMVVPPIAGRAVQVGCPKCSSQLVVDTGMTK